MLERLPKYLPYRVVWIKRGLYYPIFEYIIHTIKNESYII